jgi:hypothetical protein
MPTDGLDEFVSTFSVLLIFIVGGRKSWMAWMAVKMNQDANDFSVLLLRMRGKGGQQKTWWGGTSPLPNASFARKRARMATTLMAGAQEMSWIVYLADGEEITIQASHQLQYKKWKPIIQ